MEPKQKFTKLIVGNNFEHREAVARRAEDRMSGVNPLTPTNSQKLGP